MARWSYSPAILSWEFWNEVNIIEKYISEDSVPWHREMARYLRELDPYDHLITTSWAGTEGDPDVDALPEMDYIQSHQYGARDAAAHGTAGVCRGRHPDEGRGTGGGGLPLLGAALLVLATCPGHIGRRPGAR